jgi:predicted transcriptional regulator
LPKILELYSPGESSVADDLLLSVRPQYERSILSGKKRVELRRKFSTKWLGHKVNLYASGPVMQMMGQATVSRIVFKAPELIWTEFKTEIGCSREEFDNYTAGASEIYAVELDEVTPFRNPVSRSDAAALLRDRLVPPQSYCTLEKNKTWAKALSLASFLQGAFKGRWLSEPRPAETAMPPILSSHGRVLSSQVRRMFA